MLMCSEPVILEICVPVTNECLQKKDSLFGSLCEPLMHPFWQSIWRLLVIFLVVDSRPNNDIMTITVRFMYFFL